MPKFLVKSSKHTLIICPLLYLVVFQLSQFVSRASPFLSFQDAEIVGNDFKNFARAHVSNNNESSIISIIVESTEKSPKETSETTASLFPGNLLEGSNIFKAVGGASEYIRKQVTDLFSNIAKRVQGIPGIKGLAQSLDAEGKDGSISNALLKTGEEITGPKTTTEKSTRKPKITTVKPTTVEEDEEEDHGSEVDV